MSLLPPTIEAKIGSKEPENRLEVFSDIGSSSDWAENVIQSMSLDQKIGQLFIVPACPLRDADHRNDLEKIIKQYHIGGVILTASDPEKHIVLINDLQQQSSLPLICVMDAEWGLGMRLQNTLSFPKNLTLGAIQNKDFLFKLGKEIGRQCKKVGVDLILPLWWMSIIIQKIQSFT